MVRSLALGFGMVTALAVAGSMTPAGQGMLGQRHPAQSIVQVSSIQDKPVAIPGPAQSLAPAAAPKAVSAPAPRRVASSTSTVSPAPHRSQAAPAARPPVAAAPRASQPPQAGQAQGGLGGMAGIANILLNLPQVLDQSHGGASHSPDSWSGSRPAPGQDPSRAHRWQQGQGSGDKEPDENH